MCSMYALTIMSTSDSVLIYKQLLRVISVQNVTRRLLHIQVINGQKLVINAFCTGVHETRISHDNRDLSNIHKQTTTTATATATTAPTTTTATTTTMPT